MSTRFFGRSSGLTVAEIATLAGAVPSSGTHLDHIITNIAPLDLAGPNDLTFFEDASLSDALNATCAGACLMPERFQDRAPSGLAVLRTAEPYRAFVVVARKLFPDALRPSSLFELAGIADGATVHESARLEHAVVVDPGAVIGPRVEIGAGTIIGPNVAIGPDVCIGRQSAIGAGSTITHALLGDRVIVHPGCHIGQDGFGYMPGSRGHSKIPQVGRVIIQDDVEIGAGTSIDRGGMRDTFIGEGTKIDNLVQIGHNVSVGRHCVIVSQTGISGSVTVGDHVLLGGQVGIADHLTIGDGAQIGARGGVMSNVPAGARWAGYPAQPLKEWLRGEAVLRKLARRGRSGKTEALDE